MRRDEFCAGFGFSAGCRRGRGTGARRRARGSCGWLACTSGQNVEADGVRSGGAHGVLVSRSPKRYAW